MASAVSASSWRFRGRGARARTCETRAPGQVECDESGAVGERLKRPWGGQWAKGQEVSVNLHWWSRRSGATARFWAAGVWKLTDISVAQVQSRQVDQGTQAGKICTEKGASVGAGVRYSNIFIDRLGGQRFKLAISGREARARTFNLLAPTQVECDESGAVGEWFKRPWEEQWAKGPEVSVNLHWWSRRSGLQVGDFETRGACTNLQSCGTTPSRV